MSSRQSKTRFIQELFVRMTYNQNVFDVSDLTRAKRLILTPDGCSTEERWERETPYLAWLIGDTLALTKASVVLDYGCGIGRLAKELINRYGCRVVGADISPSMRAHATRYVESDRFSAYSLEQLNAVVVGGPSFDAAIAVWVLQHCLRPRDDIALIRRSLKPAGRFFVVNHRGRRVPTVEHGWVDDGIDIRALLTEEFVLDEELVLEPSQVNDAVARFGFCGTFKPKPD